MTHKLELSKAQCRYGVFSFPTEDKFIGRSLREYGEWGQQEITFILNLLEDDYVVIDGGANVGTHSIPMAQYVGAGGVIHAFESNKLVYQVLVENLRNNAVSNVMTYPFALSHTPGVIYQQAISRTGGTSIAGNSPPSSALLDGVEASTRIQIDSLRLERCDFMKLALAGTESNALIGALTTINEYHPVIYSKCDSIEDGWLIMNILRPMGYKFWLHKCDVFSPDNFNHSSVDIFDRAVETNLLCIPSSEQQPIRKIQLFQETIYATTTLDDLALAFVQSGKIEQHAFEK